MSVSFSPHPCQYYCNFLMVSILTGVRFYLIILSIYLHASDWRCWASSHVPVGHLSFSEKNVNSGLLPNFKLGCFNVELYELFIYFGIYLLVTFANNFSPLIGWLFFFSGLLCCKFYLVVDDFILFCLLIFVVKWLILSPYSIFAFPQGNFLFP